MPDLPSQPGRIDISSKHGAVAEVRSAQRVQDRGQGGLPLVLGDTVELLVVQRLQTPGDLITDRLQRAGQVTPTELVNHRHRHQLGEIDIAFGLLTAYVEPGPSRMLDNLTTDA